MTLIAAFGTLGAPAFAQDSAQRLEFADPVVMVSCDPVSAAPVPAFRVKFNIVDSKGSPAPIQLPSAETLAASLFITVNGRQVTPFYVDAQGASSIERHRITLILVDVSGSMKTRLVSGETRFDAARASLMAFLDKFKAGVDEVGIVSFESHGVDAQIGRVRFATSKAEAMEQVNALPIPTGKNNTALYSAVVDGLDVLARTRNEGHASSQGAESMLVVMTDGRNEVLPGDDSNLLAGPGGLTQAAEKVRLSKSQVIGIGFGNPAEIDETALGQISTKKFMAQDRAELSKIFDFASVLLHSRVIASFSTPWWPDRASLAGASLDISAVLKLASGVALPSGHKIWTTPQIGIPGFEGSCGRDETLALIHQNAPPGNGWIQLLRPLMVFMCIGLLLLILWFWVPRLVWADQYVGIAPVAQRWANRPSGIRGEDGNAPRGFGATKGTTRPARAPSDATIVQPRPDFSKTRLDRDKYS